MAPTERGDDPLRATLAAVAPGTALRDGLERILRGRTGALIVLGYDKMVESAVHRRLRARRRVQRHPAARAGEDGRRHRGRPRLHQDPARRRAAGARPGHPHRRVRHPAPHRRPGQQADRPAGDLGQPVDEHHRHLRRRSALRARGRRPRSCPGPTRRWPPSSATSSAWTRCPARCRRWRSRTWSRSATSPRSPSGWRWCAGSPARSSRTSSSWAPTAGCSRCSSTS